MRPALTRYYYYGRGGGYSVLLSENFTGDEIDTEAGTITNPDAANLSITLDNRLLFTRVTDNLVSTLGNKWETVDSFTRVTASVIVKQEVGFISSPFFFRYTVDANNYITIQPSANKLRGFVVQNGSVVYDIISTESYSDARIKFVYNNSNEISFWKWNTLTESWVQFGETFTANLGATGKVWLGTTSSPADAAGDKFSFNQLRITDRNFEAEVPDTSSTGAQASAVAGVTTYYDATVNQFSEFKPIDHFHTFGAMINTVDGYCYFAAMSMGGQPLNRSHYIFKYNTATNSVVQKVHIPKEAGITSAFDTHVCPVVQFDAAGHVYMSVEKSRNSTGWSDGHTTDVLIYKTTVAGDLTTMTLWKTLQGKYSYPKLWIDGANYYMIARGLRGFTGDIGKTTLEKSTNSGSTWTEINIINIPTGTPIRRVYSQIIHSDDATLYLAWNIRNDTDGSFESAGVIKSTDGVTWSNFEGTFSKDVVASGALTESELTTNCQIWNTATPATESITFEGAYVKAGVIKILLGRQTLTGVVVEGNAEGEYTELRLFTYSAGWIFEDCTAIVPVGLTHFWAYQRILQYVPSASGDTICVLDRRDTNNITFTEYTSDDAFATNSSRLLWSGAGNYMYGAHAYNAEEGKVFVLFNTQDTYLDTNDWSYLRIINVE